MVELQHERLMDSEYDLNALRYYDFAKNESFNSIDDDYFQKPDEALLSPNMKKEKKENFEEELKMMKIKAFKIDLSKRQKGAKPGGIGDFSKITLFNRQNSRLAERARRRSQQIVIEDEVKPQTEELISNRKNSLIPISTNKTQRRASMTSTNDTTANIRKPSLGLPPLNMTLRPRNDIGSSQKQGSIVPNNRRLSSSGFEADNGKIRRQSYGAFQQSNQTSLIHHGSSLKNSLISGENVHKKIENQVPINQGPITRRRSLLQQKKENEPVIIPQPQKARRRSLINNLNLPPISSIFNMKKKEEEKKENTEKKQEDIKKEAPIISRRYATRSTTNR